MHVLKSFLYVLGTMLLLIAIVATGIFDNNYIECGFEHYAEAKYGSMFPLWLLMPMNSLVNVGYIAVGLMWLRYLNGVSLSSTSVSEKDKLPNDVSSSSVYYLNVFSWMTVFYAPVQFLRIQTQRHRFAVFDQWVTLPFFTWLILFTMCLEKSNLSNSVHWMIYGISLGSYFLTLFTKVGFEIILVVHITIAAIFSYSVQYKHGNRKSLMYLHKALLCCIGFVILKVFDKELSVWPLFETLTGHFWSKVCDFLQIHYALHFCISLTESRNIGKKRA